MVKRALIACLLALAAGTAHADDDIAAAIDRAREHRAALRYREALDQIEGVIATGKAGPAEMAELYRLAGELAGGLDEPSTARRWFANWLALDDEARLADDASPKLRDPLEAARVAMAGRRIVLRVTRAGSSVTVSVDDDVLGLVRRVRVGTSDGLPGATLPLSSVDHPHTAVALDEFGNALAETAVPAGARSPSARHPIHLRWQTWAIATGGLSITGGLFAWRTSVAQDQFDDLKNRGATFTETEAARRRGERDALITNLAFGTAAATAALSVVLALRIHDDAPVTMSGMLQPGHAGIALIGRF